MKSLQVALVIWTVIGQAVGFCPRECDCDGKNVTCSSKGQLDIIPITLNPMIKRLTLKGNKIRVVDASFQFYSQLEYVDFSDNQMDRLPNKGFAKQRKLVELKIDNNHVVNVTNSSFVGLQSLRAISMRGNRLASLEAKLFMFLPMVSNAPACLMESKEP